MLHNTPLYTAWKLIQELFREDYPNYQLGCYKPGCFGFYNTSIYNIDTEILNLWPSCCGVVLKIKRSRVPYPVRPPVVKIANHC